MYQKDGLKCFSSFNIQSHLFSTLLAWGNALRKAKDMMDR